MRNVLVTGGAGFIGSNFVRYLLAHEPQIDVVNIDALTYAGSPENLRDLPAPDRHHFVHGDINDTELLERLFMEREIDTVVHFAAESHVDRSILGPAPFVQTNVLGTLALLEAARAAWSEPGPDQAPAYRFHHISTDEVYGSLRPKDPAFHEGTPYSPNSPYAATKAASDHLVRAFHHTYGLPMTITNCSNNYGPQQFPEKLIPLMLLNAERGRELPLYGDGGQVRDWLYVVDHCEAIHRVLLRGRVGETYNVGGENQPTNLEVVELLCAILDERFPSSPHRPHASLIRFVEDRPGHDRRYAMDISKIRADLEWEPRETLESGLRRTVDWYLENDQWVRKIEARPSYEEWLQENYAQRKERL